MRATVLAGPRSVTVENVPDPVLARARRRHRQRRAHGHLRIGSAPVPRRPDGQRHSARPRGDRDGGRRRAPRPQPEAGRSGARLGRGRLRDLRSVPRRPTECLPRRHGHRLRHDARPPRRPGRGDGGPVRRPLRPPDPRGHHRRGGRAPHRHSPTGYLGALPRLDSSRASTVVVVGLGPVGIMALQCASLFGPARILAVDMVPERLARAERLGAEPIDARIAPGSAQVLEATGGRGAESVIEAVGADATVVEAVACAATGGTVSVVGVNLTMDLPFPMGIVFLKSLTLRGGVRPDSRDLVCARPAPAVRPPHRAGRDVHPPHGPEPGPRGLRVVRLPGPTVS